MNCVLSKLMYKFQHCSVKVRHAQALDHIPRSHHFIYMMTLWLQAIATQVAAVKEHEEVKPQLHDDDCKRGDRVEVSAQ